MQIFTRLAAVVATLLTLGLTAFVAQQTVGYDISTSSVCFYDKASTSQCQPLVSVDSINHLLTLVTPRIKITATSGRTLFFAGQNVDVPATVEMTGNSTSAAEEAFIARMTSTAGDNSVGHYKAAGGFETTCSGATSAYCWGLTSVLTTGADYPTASQYQISVEVDHNNNSGTNCGDADYGVTGSPCGELFMTGAGTNQLSFGVGIAGNNMTRNGLAIYTGGAIAAAVRDYSAAQYSYRDTGKHINGLDASGAVITGNWLVSPSNLLTVSGAGFLTTARPIIQNNYVYNTAATSGGSVTLANTDGDLILNQANVLATFSVTLQGCNAANKGRLTRISTTDHAITSLSLSAAAGSVVGNPGSMTTWANIAFRCVTEANAWIRVE